MGAPTVIAALRQFLPEYLATRPVLSPGQWRAVHAILHCRTPAMGGHVHACPDCGESRFAWHSCNHKACPQCGGDATAKWVERQLERRIKAPYFMVTFTLPEELREMFHGPLEKDAFGIFFKAVAGAMEHSLASAKGVGAVSGGFTSLLHTWNQKLLFHPHIHCIVPGAGLDVDGKLARAKDPQFLVPLPILRAAFRRAFRTELEKHQWQVDPTVWNKDWGVHVQPCGNGASAVKYLGAYVAKSAISDARMVAMDENTVTFRWKDRAHGNAQRLMTVTGVEFVRRYLRHALPPGMHSIRHYGFQHPASVKKRERVRFLSGMDLKIGPVQAEPAKPRPGYLCPCCGKPMLHVGRIPKPERGAAIQSRAPPTPCAA